MVSESERRLPGVGGTSPGPRKVEGRGGEGFHIARSSRRPD
jgi:hypothetical protein